ncbi:glycosyl transferase, partial [Kocuria sp. CCUG 69068]|nr:glycosyl transferase [Kocuria sp. CCUG 69068]
DAALRARMGAAGRAEAEGLGWRAATEFLVASYEEAVRRHRSRRPPPRHPRG